MEEHCALCKKRSKALAEGKLVEATNSMHLSDFFQTFFKVHSDEWLDEPTESTLPTLHTIWGSAESLQGQFLDDCFQLVEKTSADRYRDSEIKWSPAKKRKEMKLPDMRYIVMMEAGPQRKMAGFVSFMITYEDGHEVIYCYEIHVSEPLRGKGLGKKLMKGVEDIGRKVGVEKSMLTVFKSNDRAVKMYESLGYVEDEYSPSPKTLRSGTVKEPTYQILSKVLQEST